MVQQLLRMTMLKVMTKQYLYVQSDDNSEYVYTQNDDNMVSVKLKMMMNNTEFVYDESDDIIISYKKLVFTDYMMIY